jgi:hypothetical protein
VRRNPDARLRELERRVAAGEEGACPRLVAARIRHGLPRYGVVASMLLGNECAREALGLKPEPRLTPYLPWGFVVGNGWAGPWPDCCDLVDYHGHTLRIAGHGRGLPSPPIGHMLNALSHLGVEYFLAFAANAVMYTSFRFGIMRGASLADVAIGHARHLAIEKSGDMSPHTHIMLEADAERATAAAEAAEGHESSMVEAWQAIRDLAIAAAQASPERMIQGSINAMAHATNALLVPDWGSIVWESDSGHWRPDMNQWARAEQLLMGGTGASSLYAMLDHWLSPWLLGFEPGPGGGT